jgi:hypothetical protein
VADINDRLDRLHRREEFDRFGRPLRPAEDSVEPVVTRPAGVDDRLGEVLDAVAAVVRRHPGLSVMVAVADGRAGRPVVRVTERDGCVETGVVVAGPSAGPAAVSPAPAAQQAAVPTAARREPVPTRDAAFAQPARETPVPNRDPAFAQAARESAVPAGDPVFESPARELPPRERELPARDPAYGPGSRRAGRDPASAPAARGTAVPAGDPVFESAARVPGAPPARDLVPGAPAAGDAARARAVSGSARGTASTRESASAGPAPIGRHAAPHDDEPAAGWSGSSWHNALWSSERSRSPESPRDPEPDRLRLVPGEGFPAERIPGERVPGERVPGERLPGERLPGEGFPGEGLVPGERLVPERGASPPPPGPTIPLPEDTSQVVSRLAQLLRENPTLASSWSREAPE